jgi:hypothetical protein
MMSLGSENKCAPHCEIVFPPSRVVRWGVVLRVKCVRVEVLWVEI